jgi:hypothetical protein
LAFAAVLEAGFASAAAVAGVDLCGAPLAFVGTPGEVFTAGPSVAADGAVAGDVVGSAAKLALAAQSTAIAVRY